MDGPVITCGSTVTTPSSFETLLTIFSAQVGQPIPGTSNTTVRDVKSSEPDGFVVIGNLEDVRR